MIFLLFQFMITFFPTSAESDWASNYRRPSQIPAPKENQISKDRIELGQLLFFEPRISGPGVMTCATCHNPNFGWTDGQPITVGYRHQKIKRKTPTIANLAWSPTLNWNGSMKSLEQQAIVPLTSPSGMNGKMEDILKFLIGNSEYKQKFAKAYPGEGISEDTVAKAIATFVRTRVSSASPFDEWVNGSPSAISKSAQKGFRLFVGKAGCAGCHSGWAFSDYQFYDIGINDEDTGRGKHDFKTPTLREVTSRYPYFHNGSASSLEEVVEFYNRGPQINRVTISPLIKPLNLSQTEMEQLIDFLKTLTSKEEKLPIPRLPL